MLRVSCSIIQNSASLTVQILPAVPGLQIRLLVFQKNSNVPRVVKLTRRQLS